MKRTKHLAALAACVLALLAAGCDNGMTDAAVAAVAASQRPGTGSSHVPSMPDGEIDDDGVLTKYTGSETAVVIPDGVTSIGSWAFSGCEGLTSVTIHEGVTSIGWDAFEGCTSLTDVTYTGTFAQWCAMSNDEYLMSYAKTVIVEGTDLKQTATLAIPGGVTSIGNCAFYGCASLTSVAIPDSVTSIGWGAFERCTKLKEIQFNGTKAQWQAIEGSGTVAVPCIQCSDGYLGVKDVPAYLIMVGTEVTGYADGLPANLVIPDGVTGIGESAFSGCTSLVSVAIPDSVTEIRGNYWSGNGAFSGCTNLTSVTIGNGVTGIGNGAFRGCTSLESVTIPASVTNIGGSAFRDCTSLASVTIPDSVTSIEGYAFYGCANLDTVTYQGTLAQWCAMYDVSDLMYYAKHVTVEGTDLKQAENLEIPDGVTRIGSYAFYGCTSLESVTIPATVTSIGYYAFYGCTSLESVTIGNGVTSIGYDAFYGCAKLKVIHFNGTMAQWNAIQGVYNGMVPGISCTDGYLGIKDIPDYLTMSGTTVTGYSGEVPAEIVIPDGVTEIGWSAFKDCTSLASVTIPDSVTKIGWSAFKDCTSLASVTIPDSVTKIGRESFYGCTSLTSVEIPDSVTSIEYNMFNGCTGLTSVEIPDSVTEIEQGAFRDCTSLESVEIPASVTRIGSYAFWGCTSLMSVTIPDGVTRIEERTFIACTNLASVTIPASVTYIGWSAFPSNLTIVTYGGTKDDWRNIEKDYNYDIFNGTMQITGKDGVTFTVDEYGKITE